MKTSYYPERDYPVERPGGNLAGPGRQNPTADCQLSLKAAATRCAASRKSTAPGYPVDDSSLRGRARKSSTGKMAAWTISPAGTIAGAVFEEASVRCEPMTQAKRAARSSSRFPTEAVLPVKSRVSAGWERAERRVHRRVLEHHEPDEREVGSYGRENLDYDAKGRVTEIGFLSSGDRIRAPTAKTFTASA